jgi:hypothetical protein
MLVDHEGQPKVHFPDLRSHAKPISDIRGIAMYASRSSPRLKTASIAPEFESPSSSSIGPEVERQAWSGSVWFLRACKHIAIRSFATLLHMACGVHDRHPIVSMLQKEYRMHLQLARLTCWSLELVVL